MMIELDDASHEEDGRRDRDTFVDAATLAARLMPFAPALVTLRAAFGIRLPQTTAGLPPEYSVWRLRFGSV